MIESDPPSGNVPLNSNTYRGFNLQIVDFKRNALVFVMQFLRVPLRAFYKIASPRSVQLASASPAAKQQIFMAIRMEVMREVRQKNLAIFAKELQLSGAELSRVMKRINPAYDALYDSDFDFACDNAPQPTDDNGKMAALWTAHEATAPLCERPLASYAWQYAASMEAIADEINHLLELRSGIIRSPRLASFSMKTIRPYADIHSGRHYPAQTSLLELCV